MLVTKVIESEMRAERMNGRNVLYYLGWNYGWRDEHIRVGHIGKNYYEVTVRCEYDTIDSINLAPITTRNVLDYLKESGLICAATLEEGIVIAIQLTIPVEDGMWKGYDEYQEELMELENEKIDVDELPLKVTEVNGYFIEDIDFDCMNKEETNMKNLRQKLEAMGWSFVGRNDSDMIEFNGYPEEVDSKATLELVKNGYIEEYNYINVETCEEETMLILKIYPITRAKKIITADTIGAYIERNDEKTIIDKVCEEAAEDGVLSDMELEQIHEEMLDELFQKQLEEEKADKESKEYAYKYIAEYIWNAAHKAIEEGNLAESMAIGEVYNQWIEVCVKAGVM